MQSLAPEPDRKQKSDLHDTGVPRSTGLEKPVRDPLHADANGELPPILAESAQRTKSSNIQFVRSVLDLLPQVDSAVFSPIDTPPICAPVFHAQLKRDTYSVMVRRNLDEAAVVIWTAHAENAAVERSAGGARATAVRPDPTRMDVASRGD